MSLQGIKAAGRGPVTVMPSAVCASLRAPEAALFEGAGRGSIRRLLGRWGVGFGKPSARGPVTIASSAVCASLSGRKIGASGAALSAGGASLAEKR
ncbi:MAG: hypothetical protein LBG71_01860 [Clostridiales Family XIII bacterium]|jgi:hypothetical protein|nr:hypothetical protein [Clostridiales Family XIII bacterium]